MKKLLAAALSLVFVAATAVSFTACSSDPVVKIIPYDLSSESYGIGIQKGNTALKTQIDSILTELINDGVEIDGETVTFEDIYLEEMQALENGEFLDIGPVATESTNARKSSWWRPMPNLLRLNIWQIIRSAASICRLRTFWRKR